MIARWVRVLRDQVAQIDDAGRWTSGRKDALLELIRRGDLTDDEACARYSISPEELASWKVRVKAHGRRGLSITKLQEIGR